jgi:hypothetical protein
VQGVDFDVGGCSHPHLRLYHLERLSSLRRVRLGV